MVCGKSNIVDAISWVLGEQSHKSLRAERMSDCIFNGTAKRPPMGLSEGHAHARRSPRWFEAAKFVLEGGADEPHGPIAVPDSAYGSTEKALTHRGRRERRGRRRKSAEDVSEIDDVGANDHDEPKFLKKRRAAEKPAMHLKPGEVIVGRAAVPLGTE